MKILFLIVSTLFFSSILLAKETNNTVASIDKDTAITGLIKLVSVAQDSDKIKITSIQGELIKILTEGKSWFQHNIGKKVFENDSIIKYKALATSELYAQSCEGYNNKKGKDIGLNYLCIYTNKKSIAIAMQAIDELIELKNSEWMIVKTSTDYRENQILYFNGIEVGATTYFKTFNPKFEISIKYLDK